MGVNLAVEPALEGWPVGWFVPEYKLLVEVWETLIEVLAEAILPRRGVDAQQKRIKLRTGGLIECWSFDRNPRAGRSRRYKRAIFDEAAHTEQLEKAWTQAVRPTLTDFKGDGWFLSSPLGENHFKTLYEHGQAGRAGWKSWTQTSYDNPFLDPAEIDDARHDLPDAVYRQEYLAEFLADLVQQLIDAAWLDACYTDDRPRRRGLPALSLDLAKGTGRDRMVALVADDSGVLDLVVDPNVGVAAAARLAQALAVQWGVPHDRIVYDAGGWAGPDMTRYLEAQGIVSALPYLGGVPGGLRFANRRTRGAWALRQRLDPGRPRANPQPKIPPGGWLPEVAHNPTRVPPPFAAQPVWAMPAPVVGKHWMELRKEVLALRYAYKGHRYELEHKEDLTRRLGHSPDLADAFIMLASLWGVD